MGFEAFEQLLSFGDGGGVTCVGCGHRCGYGSGRGRHLTCLEQPLEQRATDKLAHWPRQHEVEAVERAAEVMRKVPAGLPQVPLPELMQEMLEWIDDVVDELNIRKEVEYVHTILDKGTSADRQLKLYRECRDLRGVVDQLVAETKDGCGVGEPTPSDG